MFRYVLVVSQMEEIVGWLNQKFVMEDILIYAGIFKKFITAILAEELETIESFNIVLIYGNISAWRVGIVSGLLNMRNVKRSRQNG